MRGTKCVRNKLKDRSTSGGGSKTRKRWRGASSNLILRKVLSASTLDEEDSMVAGAVRKAPSEELIITMRDSWLLVSSKIKRMKPSYCQARRKIFISGSSSIWSIKLWLNEGGQVLRSTTVSSCTSLMQLLLTSIIANQLTLNLKTPFTGCNLLQTTLILTFKTISVWCSRISSRRTRMTYRQTKTLKI